MMGKQRKIDLCGVCAATAKAEFEIRLLPKPTNYKVTCQGCGRRRYGGSYEITKIAKEKVGK